jgi:3-oxoadipate enol-lactonase
MPNVTVNGVRLHYLDVGTGGPVVVLLHAFPLQARMWQQQMDALGERARLVAPDLKGFGGSDAPDDPSAYSMEGYADDVAALLDHLGVEQAVLGGLSMGGYVAFAFLRRHRHRVAALVLADTKPEADTPEVLERRTTQQGTVRQEGIGPVVDAQVENLLTDHTRRQRPELVARARQLMQNPAPGYVGALEAMKQRSAATDELGAVDVPTLVLVGDQDGPSPPEVVEEMAARIPGAELVVLPQAGHLSNLEAPAAFTDALRGFLDRL